MGLGGRLAGFRGLDSLLKTAAKGGRFSSLKLDDLQTGDEPEVAEIDGQDGEAKLQRRDADKQIAEGDGYALGLLFAVDLSGQQGRCFGVGIDGQIAEQFVDEGLAAKPH